MRWATPQCSPSMSRARAAPSSIMVIYLGADHRGFALKEHLKRFLTRLGYSVADLGNAVYDENDDFTEVAAKAAGKVSVDYENTRGILICGSGVGVDVVANKFANVRSALVASADQAFDSRNDDNANVLSLGANYLEPDAAEKIVFTWLKTPFSGEDRYKRRLRALEALEEEVLKPRGEPEEGKPPSWR